MSKKNIPSDVTVWWKTIFTQDRARIPHVLRTNIEASGKGMPHIRSPLSLGTQILFFFRGFFEQLEGNIFCQRVR